MTTVPPPNQSHDSEEMDEATRRGLELYKARLKAYLEPDHNGQVVAVHPDSEDYVVAETSGDAMRAMYARHPNGQVLLHIIGPTSPASGLAWDPPKASPPE